MLRYLVDPIFQVVNTAGKPATGGYVEVYLHGTRDKYYCASDFDGTLHPFKIPLDSLGSNIVLADDGQAYDVYVYNRYGSQLMSRYNVKPGSGSGYELDKVYHDNTMTGDGTFVNPLSVTSLGKVHFLKAVSDDLADVSAPYSFWILDLEKPNAESPYGYDYAMASEIIAKLSAGEIFVLSTYSTAPSFDEDLFTMCVAQDQSSEGHPAVRINFTRMYAGTPDRMYYTAIYTPSHNGSSKKVVPEERMAIFNPFGEQSPFCSFEFMPYTSLDTVATTGNYNDLTNKPNLALKEDVANKSQTIDTSSTTEYPSSKAAADFVTSSVADVKTTTVRQNGQADNAKCPTEAAVRTAIDSAVSSAYHAAGTKTVAQLTSSLLVSANEGDVYNITDSGSTTSDFIEGAGLPISVGDNVVVCDVGGGVYKFDLLSGFVDLTSYLTKTGDGSDVTASFTATSTRTNISTGEKLSVLFGKIAKWFSDLKALAFKDKVNTNDIDDDAVTADKVKDNETLPVNITGSAKSLASSLCSYGSSGSKFRLVAKSAPLGNNVNVHFEYRISASNYNLFQSATLQFNAVYNESTNSIVFDGAKVINDHGSSNLWKFYLVPNVAEQKVEIYAESTGSNYNSLNLIALFANGEGQNYINGTTYFNTVVNSIPTPNVAVPVRTAVSTETGVGNATTPVYIDNQGVPQPCTTLWNSIKNNISSNTANVNQVDSNTETSSFTFVNGHVYNLTLTLEGSPLLISSTSSGTGYVAAYIGSSMSQRHYTCKQSVDINRGELTAKDIKLPVNWKAENITGSSDNQIHVVVVFNSTLYGFSTASPYQLILQGTDFDGA